MVAHLRQDHEELLLEWLESVTAEGGLWMGATTAEQESESARVYDACVACLDTLDYRDAEKFAEQMATAGGAGNRYLRGHAWWDVALRDVFWHSLLRHYLRRQTAR